MTKSYIEITADINRGVGSIRAGAPDAIGGFSALAKGVMKPGMLSSQLKEPIALAIGVAGHRDRCIDFHVRTLAATPREQIAEARPGAMYMGGGASLMYAADAMNTFDEFHDGPARRESTASVA